MIPEPTPTMWLLRLAIVAAVWLGAHQLLRRMDIFGGTKLTWPARWRAERAETVGDGPFRAVDVVQWHRTRDAGIPWIASFAQLPGFGLSLMWSLAVVLSLGDLSAASRGEREWALVLSSTALCVLRALLAWATLGAVLERSARYVWGAGAVAFALDAALRLWPLPCSDKRADDILMATLGLATTALMVVTFAVANRLPAGEREDDPAAQPPLN